MRLERLEIAGFGRLADLEIALSPTLTVLCGPNESGKTTVLRAVRAALYGLDAGGPGRPAARSPWARWRPWHGEGYGLALTYALADGRRVRVARSFEQRGERVQVHELGGADVTDAMRSGRAVVPGLVHLGIDENVFCATAFLTEDGLRLDAADAATARASHVQEALERLADSASRATAGEALGRLREAMERVGTEGRRRSSLGAATMRLREVEGDLERARARLERLGADEERLRALEAAAAAAEDRRVSAERDWLCARLSALTAQRAELAEALDDARDLEGACAGWAPYADFPVELEERVTSLGGELREAVDVESAAGARWDGARDEAAEVERRRREITVGIRALGSAPRVVAADLEEAAALRHELEQEAGLDRRVAAVRSAEARATGLRREIAAMGLGAVPVGSADAVAELVIEADGAARGGAAMRGAAATMAMLGMLIAAAAMWVDQRALASAAAAVGLLVAAAVLTAERLGGAHVGAARRQLERMCPGLDASPEGLARAAAQLPALRDLHADLARQQALVEAGREELEAAAERTADLTQRCRGLASRLPVTVTRDAAGGALGAWGDVLIARAVLDAVERAAEAGRRRVELEAEDAQQARRGAALRLLAEEAERAGARAAAIRDELSEHLAAAGIPLDPPLDGSVDGPVAAFRQGAATRRQLEAARARLGEVRRRMAALGPAGDAALAAQVAALSAELRRRGGDPDALPAELPLDPAHLQHLENEAERSRRQAESARAQASAVRERLSGALDGLPSLADLEDEGAACRSVRERCLHQLEALRRASELIDAAARRVHRDIAPRLGSLVGDRLAVVSEGRYAEVSVDPERFAVAVRSPDRLEMVPLDLLSRGTREQVALLLRLALVEVLGDAGEPAPLFLDDPLLSADPMRRANALGFLRRLSAVTQVVLATSDPAVAEDAAGLDGAQLVALGRRRERPPAGAPQGHAAGAGGPEARVRRRGAGRPAAPRGSW